MISQPDVAPADKSVGAALVLTFFLGPLGLLYVSVAGGLVLLACSIVFAMFTALTLGLAIPLLWCTWQAIPMIWGAVAASKQHAEYQTWLVTHGANIMSGGVPPAVLPESPPGQIPPVPPPPPPAAPQPDAPSVEVASSPAFPPVAGEPTTPALPSSSPAPDEAGVVDHNASAQRGWGNYMIGGVIGALLVVGGLGLGLLISSRHHPTTIAIAPAATQSVSGVSAPSQPVDNSCQSEETTDGNLRPLFCDGAPNPAAMAFYNPLGLRWLLNQGRGVTPGALANDLCYLHVGFGDTTAEAGYVFDLAYRIQGWIGPITPHNVWGYLFRC